MIKIWIWDKTTECQILLLAVSTHTCNSTFRVHPTHWCEHKYGYSWTWGRSKIYYLVADLLRTITAVSLGHIDITSCLMPHLVSSFEILSQPLMRPAVSAFTLLFSWLNACSIRFKSGDWLGRSKTFHFFALLKSLTELAGCVGSLFWCNKKHFPMTLVAFSWMMVLYPSKFILLLPYIKSSVKLRGPAPETACVLINTSTMLYRWGSMLGIICTSFFLHTFLSHHLD